MANRNKELAVNTIILGIGQLVPKFLSLIVLPILTTYLTTDEYGTYDLVISFASLLIPVLTLQIQQAVFRYLLTSMDGKEKTEYVTTSLCYVLVSSLIILPLVYLILELMGGGGLSSFLICLLFLSETLYNLLGQIIRGLGFNLKYSISVIVYAFVNMLFTVAIVAALKSGLYGVIISLVLGYGCADIYMMVASGMLRYINVKHIEKKILKELLSFSAPIVPSSIALWIVNLSDRMVIIHFLGASANGIYAVANKIPTLYNTAYSVFNLAWTETASRVSDDGNPAEYYSGLFKALFNFLIGTMLILIACTPIIFKLLVKGEYGAAIYQVPILYFGVFFNSFVNFYSGIYIALKRTKQVGISSAMGAILNIAINLIMVKKFGLYAASVSTALSFMVITLYRAYDLNRVIKISYDFGEILCGMLFFGISSTLLYYGRIWSIVLCFVLAAVFNLWKNMIFIKKVSALFLRKIK